MDYLVGVYIINMRRLPLPVAKVKGMVNIIGLAVGKNLQEEAGAVLLPLADKIMPGLLPIGAHEK